MGWGREKGRLDEGFSILSPAFVAIGAVAKLLRAHGPEVYCS